ncbi:MAG: 50S ribosomal protein L23 [Planctomycetes bacterium]|nr:50S ribosomal protein L23 [Planctomycetota bacterium]
MKNPFDVIVKPLVTEKVMGAMQKQNTYTFSVLPGANKIEIKSAVEHAFNVKVADVRTIRMKGKVKQYRLARGRRPDWKKAVVRLVEGSRIDIL